VEAIIAPHEGKNKFAVRTFTFTTKDGDEKTYELPSTVTFETGKAYSFTFTLSWPTFDGMTNCYIVAPDTEFTFPVSRAYTYEKKAFTTTLHTGGEYTGTFDAAIVWADAAVISDTPTVLGSGNTAEVTVKTTSTSGNAVVKICRSDNGETVWSYHIWVTDYTGAETYTNTYTYSSKQYEFIFMDRNLGATAAGTGLFYQWGRKDPFPTTDGTPTTGSWSKVTTDATLGTVTNTIKNPGVFYIASSASEYDWHYASRDNTLWGHDANGGIKTIYDPCPAGWRVPVNSGMSADTSPWYGFTKDNGGTFANGYNWGTNAVYPAAGNRSNSSGSLYRVGTGGYYWSASPYSSASGTSLLLFDSGTVYVFNNAHRASGLSVRCSQE
jgi:hypothetical protein